MNGLTAVEQSLLDMVTAAGSDGIPLSRLKQNLPSDARETTEAVRSLITAKKINIAKSLGSGENIVTLSKPPTSENFKIVLGVIRAAGPSGLDTASIITRTKIMKTEVTKALMHFVAQREIKETRSFSNKAKKLYIAAEFEPSVEITGGSFYTASRDLDVALIDQMRSAIVACIRRMKQCTVRQIKVHMDSDPLAGQRHVSLREVATVARAMQLDGVLRSLSGSQADEGDREYTLGRVVPEASPFAVTALSIEDAWAVTFPCTSCPQLAACHIGGLVNPSECVYIHQWLHGASDQHR